MADRLLRCFMSEAPAPDDQDLPQGTSVGEYVVERKLGEGGMGTVYAGVQPLIGKQVAIKVVAAAWARNEQITNRFLEEARAVNHIRHPNIIDIFSFGTLPDGRPYFVMEFLQGESLEDALVSGHIAGREIVLLMSQLCDALGAAHAAGVVHRDLKPENLWIARLPNQEVSLRVLDFGIAKNMTKSDASMTAAGDVLGTAQYMAPEQALGETIDGRTDIYALGVILYRILTGRLPFDGHNSFAVAARQVTEQPAPLSHFKPIQPALEAVVLDCMAKDPAARPQSVGDLWLRLEPELEAWAGPGLLARKGSKAGTHASTRLTIPPVVAGVTKEPAPRKGSGLRAAVLIGVIVIAGAGAGAAFLLGRGSSPAVSASNGTALDVSTKAIAPVPPPPVGLAAPDARPVEVHAALPDAAPTSVVNPIPAPPSAPAKRPHRERQSREGQDPQPL
jgi:eukaryotic-like serine/threonine-protein kinase